MILSAVTGFEDGRRGEPRNTGDLQKLGMALS